MSAPSIPYSYHDIEMSHLIKQPQVISIKPQVIAVWVTSHYLTDIGQTLKMIAVSGNIYIFCEGGANLDSFSPDTFNL